MIEGLGYLCAHIGKTGAGEPPEYGEMTLPSRHKIPNSALGGFRLEWGSISDFPNRQRGRMIEGSAPK